MNGNQLLKLLFITQTPSCVRVPACIVESVYSSIAFSATSSSSFACYRYLLLTCRVGVFFKGFFLRVRKYGFDFVSKLLFHLVYRTDIILLLCHIGNILLFLPSLLHFSRFLFLCDMLYSAKYNPCYVGCAFKLLPL